MTEVHRYKAVKLLSFGGSKIEYIPHGPDVVRAEDFDRVTAERESLQLMLNNRDDLDDQLTSLEQRRYAEQQAREAAERRVDVLEAALKFYAEREHYHFESGNWDTVSGEPLNILWCGDEPDFIEDGSVARAALNPTAEAESHDR